MPDISFVLPCRNEEKALPYVLEQIHKVISDNKLDAEIVVSDSSSDNSPQIVKDFAKTSDCEVRLVKHDKVGYGRAYIEGFSAAKGKYIVMGDADGTYDFNYAVKMLPYLDKGYDLVMGNRLKGKMQKGAMPWLHRYIGNPFLSWVLKLFFRGNVNDSHCGLRAIKKEAYDKLNLRTTGMEYASEMIIKAIKNDLKIKEIIINYNAREGDSKLNSLWDGWRHLRFMLMYSPLFLFLIPGVLLFLIGILSMIWLYLGSPVIFGVKIYFHPMFLSSMIMIVGYQLIQFAAFAKTYAVTHFGERSRIMEMMYEFLTIERASILGLVFVIFGLAFPIMIIYDWITSGFKSINEVKNLIVSMTFLILGVQTIFSSFMLSIIGIREN
ncbi:glycosyltransferase [Candidatus Woesearchaeota archaeon]|nr:glycosyltransferase [Candidatus Woesearchaeota archaeon]